jgi:molybdenum cofactor biosynthesis enzyme MoaA
MSPATSYANMRFLRASVSDVCNLNCIYCPKSAGMENYVPAELRGQYLSIDAYCVALEMLAKLGFQGLCITGGEPTANPHLPEIMERSRAHFDVLELTSNGFKLPEMLPHIAHLLDRIKISLDSPDELQAAQIARVKRDPVSLAMSALRAGLESQISMTVNTVVMRRNIGELTALISLLAELAEDYPGLLSHSLYDFYYTPTRRGIWQREFVPTCEIERLLTERLGEPTVTGGPDRRFLEYTSGRLNIIFKDTFGATPRGDICTTCTEPCQEGICSLRLSVEGWVTACPSSSSSLGTRLRTERALTPDVIEIARRVHEVRQEAHTFEKMVAFHDLLPAPF